MNKFINEKCLPLIERCMHILKVIMVTLVLLLVCCFAYSSPVSARNQTKEKVIQTYLNAVLHGKFDELEEVVDEDAQFNIKRGGNVNVMSKLQLLDNLKSFENVEQDCECTKTVIFDDDDKSIIKIDMKFGDFTRTDVVTEQRGGYGWKITKVETSFK
jgi:hypothetical protein